MDVDTGIDDALAILYAVRHPELEVLGISCVAGNVHLDQVVINTCKVLDAAGAADILVASGAAQPLIERARRKGGAHGVDGLGGIRLPEPSKQRSPLHAVELLRQLIMTSAEPVSLVTLGPKTNLALLLALYPEVAQRLQQMIFMGGSACGGAVTAVAEYNVWQDPEAAWCVIESPIPTAMYGFDLFGRLVVDRADVDRFRAHDHPVIRLAGELLQRRSDHVEGSADHYVYPLGDAGAMVMLTNPEFFVTRELPVRVNLEGIGRGQTLVDRRAERSGTDEPQPDPWPMITVALDLDVTQAAAAFVKVIDTYAARTS
jgi:pyrimidine-specific ribonucleoside hydrolase